MLRACFLYYPLSALQTYQSHLVLRIGEKLATHGYMFTASSGGVRVGRIQGRAVPHTNVGPNLSSQSDDCNKATLQPKEEGLGM